MNQQKLLDEVQRLEDDGYVVILKWDGERPNGKKTLLISLPGTDLFIRRDSDDMWASLDSALEEARRTEPKQAERDRRKTPVEPVVPLPSDGAE
ncbi:ribosome-associated translation inhibitor RaiA [Haloferula luteola]|uniref:Ribosome-associated translation inhibitor RaiA n=1 Tax=Haloferula luteola TaxID=595692 RepID=A0A840VN13_9BACT|nr:ribosome-associated translation inhibitor RaiA [Haloferula luteola]